MSPSKTTQIVLNRFIPGLVTTFPSVLLREGEAQIADNVDLDKNTIKRRDGWIKIHTAALSSGTAEVTSLYPYYFQTTKRLLALAGDHLMFSTGGDFTTLVTLIAPSQPVRATFETLNNVCYIAIRYGADLTQKLKRLSGDTITTSPSPPGSLVMQFGNALFVGGDTAAPSRLYWSGLVGTSGPDIWPAANFIDLAPGDGDVITGFGRTLNAFIVFKERSLFRVVGQPPDDAALDAGTISVQEIEGLPGCRAPRTVSSNKNNIMYLGENGLYLYDGINIQEVTIRVRPFFQDIDPINYKNAVGAWISPVKYLLSLKNAAGNLKTLMISVDPPYIATWSGTTPSAIAKYDFLGTIGEKAVIGATNGLVGRIGGNSDNGAAVSWEYTTGVLSAGSPRFVKILRTYFVQGTAGGENATIQILKDLTSTGTTKSVNFTAVGDEEIVTKRVVASSVGRNLETKITGSGAGTPTEITGLVFDIVGREV